MRIRQQSTLDVIRVIALSQMSDALKVKVQSSVKISASVIYSKLQELSISAELTGIIPVLSSTHCLKSMQELPGIVELTNSDSTRGCEMPVQGRGSPMPLLGVPHREVAGTV